MAFVLDLDGVVWIGDAPIPGAAEAVAELQRRAPVVFVTNMSRLVVADQEAKLARHGIDATGQVVTSAMAAGRLVAPGERVLIVGGPGIHEAVVGRGAAVVSDPTAQVDVVVVGFEPSFDFDDLRAATTAIRRGARLIGTNHDPIYPMPDGPWPGGGAILAAVATAGGVEPVIAGKPHAAVVAEVRQRVGDHGMVVGDRPDTDGAFARALGFDFALVLSGVTGADDVCDPVPDVVAASLADLVDAMD